MKAFGIFIVFLAFIALSLADEHDDDYYRSSYDDNAKKVVYVEKKSDYDRNPSYKYYEKEPEYKKVVYKYEKPEEKKVYVNVKVSKNSEKDQGVVYKYVEKKYKE